MKVGKDPANRDLGASGPYTFDEVAVLSTQAPDLQVCTGSKIGESCSSRAAMPGMVKCFASSTDTIDVEWEAANSQGGGLLTGYRVTAFDREDQVVAFVNSTAETRVTFAHGAVNANQRVKYSIRYSVQVEALYDKASIASKIAVCNVPQDGLPCIPPPTAAFTTNVGGPAVQLNSLGEASNCPCITSRQVYDQLDRGTYMCTCVCVCVCSIMWYSLYRCLCKKKQELEPTLPMHVLGLPSHPCAA